MFLTFRATLRTALGAAIALWIALPVAARDFGIDFAAMPVGCAWHLEYSDGNRWVARFLGEREGLYVVETTEDRRGRRLVQTSDYDRRGHLVRRVWANGKWELFEPRSCFAVGGRCTNVYRNADGANVRQHSQVSRRGDTLTVAAGEVGGPDYATDTVVLGPFGVATESRNANFWSRVTAFETCGAAGS
jgi:hypothetical protein